MIYKSVPGQKEQEWAKIRVMKSKVEVAARFRYALDLNQAHKLFVSSNNRLVLDFKIQHVAVLRLSETQRPRDFATLTPLSNFQLAAKIQEPLYFSPDFTTYFDLSSTKNSFIFYRLKEGEAQYEVFNAFNIPSLDILAVESSTVYQTKQTSSTSCHYLMELSDHSRLRYLTKHSNLERTLPIDKDLTSTDDDEDRLQILEKVYPHSAEVRAQLFFSRSTRGMMCQGRSVQMMSEGEAIKDHAQFRGVVERQLLSESYIWNAGQMKALQCVTEMKWRVCELLSSDRVDIKTAVSKKQLNSLHDVMFPNGDTLLHKLFIDNSQNLKGYLDLIEENSLDLRLIQNHKGLTVLDYCLRDSNIEICSRIFKILEKQTYLNGNGQAIKDLLPDLLSLCPYSTSRFLDSRLINVPWVPSFSEGKLIQVEGDTFSIGMLNLYPLDPKFLKQEFFEQQQDLTDQTEVRLPIQMVVADIPNLHWMRDKVGSLLLDKILQIQTSDVIYSTKYIQALIEAQWGMLRAAIIKKVFKPFLMYLVLFNVYAVYLVNKRDENDFLKILSIIIEVVIVFLIVQSFIQQFNLNSQQQLKRHIWFYIDILSRFLVLVSILIFYTVEFKDLIISINAISTFGTWILLLSFFRLFRGTGYLITLILEVIQDMRFFVAVITVTLLAFTSTFFILSTTSDADESLDSMGLSYLNSASSTYQLLLGQFDTSSFNAKQLPLTWAFFILATLFLIIVMLNLLISIISDTFARVSSRAKQLMYGEFAQLIVEHRHLVTEEEMQAQERKGRYMYIAWIDDTQQRSAANAEQGPENRGLRQMAEIQKLVALLVKGQEEDRVRLHDQLCELKKQVAEIRAAVEAKE